MVENWATLKQQVSQFPSLDGVTGSFSLARIPAAITLFETIRPKLFFATWVSFSRGMCVISRPAHWRPLQMPQQAVIEAVIFTHDFHKG